MIYDNDPELLEAMISAYVLNNAEEKLPVTIAGFALYLGIPKRELEALGATGGCERPFELLKTHVEHYALARLYSNSPTGGIFALKQMGYSDTPAKVTADVHVHLSGTDGKL